MNAYSNCNNSLSVGDIIKFGNYYKNDDKTKEPLEWRVLEVSNDKGRYYLGGMFVTPLVK